MSVRRGQRMVWLLTCVRLLFQAGDHVLVVVVGAALWSTDTRGGHDVVVDGESGCHSLVGENG